MKRHFRVFGRLVAVGAGVLLILGAGVAPGADPPEATQRAVPIGGSDLVCAPDNAGLKLPDGFCALVVADGIPRARQMAVADNGDIFVASYGSRRQSGAGGVYALRDTSGDGKADVRIKFGERGGHGALLHGEHLYFSTDDAVYRYTLPAGSLEPSGPPETIISGLPSRHHGAKSMVIDDDGTLFVNIGSPSNVCAEQTREPGSPGLDPCPQREVRAAIWKFDANRAGQTLDDGERYASGVRHAVALKQHPSNGGLYAVVHGRDRLFQSWPEYYTAEDGAEKPSEEFIRIEEGDDFGWPYCYHDPITNRRVLAPEYGGDGTKLGRCADMKAHIFGFPGHWAPNGLLFYTGSMLPERFRNGIFVSFHGSWNRAPLEQQGHNVVFLPLNGDEPAGPFEVFADGFAGANVEPRGAAHRPVDIAQAPDGSVLISDDSGGTIWRIVYER